jgi:uncharacterized protein YxeA
MKKILIILVMVFAILILLPLFIVKCNLISLDISSSATEAPYIFIECEVDKVFLEECYITQCLPVQKESNTSY